MDKKSAEILDILKSRLTTGTLSIKDFPQENVLNMVKAEYNYWIAEKIKKLDEYIDTYTFLLSRAREKNDSVEYQRLFNELHCDLQKNPVEVLEHIEELEKVRDRVIVDDFIEKAKNVYNNYPFNSELGKNAFEGRGVIYTVITGEYDKLREPEKTDGRFDYICFTDNTNLRSEVWDIRIIENEEKLDKVRTARKYKILCHEFLKEYDYSVYVDGKIQIIGDIRKYMESYSKGSPMLCFPHFARSCAYEEAVSCIKFGKDDAAVITKQMNKYRQEGYPVNNGLVDSACLVRQHHNILLQKTMEDWWAEVQNGSRRDQLSIGYVCWKNNFHYDLSDLFIYHNEYICKKRDRETAY